MSAVRDGSPASSQTDEMSKKDMTDEELAKLRAELRQRQKAAMVCASFAIA